MINQSNQSMIAKIQMESADMALTTAETMKKSNSTLKTGSKVIAMAILALRAELRVTNAILLGSENSNSGIY